MHRSLQIDSGLFSVGVLDLGSRSPPVGDIQDAVKRFNVSAGRDSRIGQ